MKTKLLIINPGSTSTKVSYFEDETNVYTESIFLDAPELLKYPTTNDQSPMRKQVILDFLQKLPRRPALAAFTATATAQVRSDIVRILQLQDPVTVVTGFDRPNLRF